MCTCLIAGRKATLSGRVMLAANNDWDGVPGLLSHKERQTHGPEETYRLVGGFQIPQVPESCGYHYTACRYEIGCLDRGWAGGVNDRGVAVAGTGASAFREIPCAGAKLEPDDIPLLILERAASAREGIRMIGEMVARYGFGPSGLEECQSMATYGVADAEEGWFLEMAPGEHWIAVRVPDDEAAVRINAFGTHEADLTDRDNVMASPGLADYARAQGWWDGDERRFDFAAVYGADHSPNEWGPELDPMNMRRRWRAMCLLSGRDDGEDALVYSVRPDRPLTVRDFTDVLRDVYQGTPYDLTDVPAAGRYGDPFHDQPASYSLCRAATVASFAADFSRSQAVMWTALSTPATSCYIPLYVPAQSLPRCCEGTSPDGPSLFWEFKELFYLTQRRYAPHSALVRPALEGFESRMVQVLAEERGDPTALTASHVEEARALCRDLRRQLMERY